MKAYDRENAQRKSDEERKQVFKFGHKIISNSLNDFYNMLVHIKIELVYFKNKASKVRLAQDHATHHSGQTSLEDLI